MAQVAEVKFSSHKEEVLQATNETVYAWLKAIGEDAAHTAANKAPVDTGRLKNSISSIVDMDNKVVYIGTNVRNEKGHCYALDQEFGTSKGIVGKHFIEFGATAHLDTYGRLLEQMLKQ